MIRSAGSGSKDRSTFFTLGGKHFRMFHNFLILGIFKSRFAFDKYFTISWLISGKDVKKYSGTMKMKAIWLDHWSIEWFFHLFHLHSCLHHCPCHCPWRNWHKKYIFSKNYWPVSTLKSSINVALQSTKHWEWL